MRIKNHIPNSITVLNLLSGSLSVIFVFSGNLALGGWFILLAAVFDLADGLFARLLHATSKTGVVLDSLADVVSFGMAPAMIVFQLLRVSQPEAALTISGTPVLPFLGLSLLVTAALRLAVFTTDESQKETFRGMPTPAAAIYFAALPLVSRPEPVFHLVNNVWFLAASTILISFLMVSPLPMLSMKFKDLSWRNNAPRYILIGISLILLFFTGMTSVPLIIILYVLISVLSGTRNLNRKTN